MKPKVTMWRETWAHLRQGDWLYLFQRKGTRQIRLKSKLNFLFASRNSPSHVLRKTKSALLGKKLTNYGIRLLVDNNHSIESTNPESWFIYQWVARKGLPSTTCTQNSKLYKYPAPNLTLPRQCQFKTHLILLSLYLFGPEGLQY